MPSPVIEADVQAAILKLLRGCGLGARKITVPRARGQSQGTPDIYTTLPGGVAFWIEVKRPVGPRGGRSDGELRDEQAEFLAWVTDHGAVGIVARCLADVRSVLERYGITA